MSHITLIKPETEIRNIDLLNAAAKSLGLQLTESNIVRGYGGTKRTADVVWRVNEKYDIGALKMEDGTYRLLADWWGVGEALKDKLVKEYQAQKVLKEAKILGHKLKSKTVLPDMIEIRLLV